MLAYLLAYLLVIRFQIIHIFESPILHKRFRCNSQYMLYTNSQYMLLSLKNTFIYAIRLPFYIISIFNLHQSLLVIAYICELMLKRV